MLNEFEIATKNDKLCESWSSERVYVCGEYLKLHLPFTNLYPSTSNELNKWKNFCRFPSQFSLSRCLMSGSSFLFNTSPFKIESSCTDWCTSLDLETSTITKISTNTDSRLQFIVYGFFNVSFCFVPYWIVLLSNQLQLQNHAPHGKNFLPLDNDVALL